MSLSDHGHNRPTSASLGDTTPSKISQGSTKNFFALIASVVAIAATSIFIATHKKAPDTTQEDVPAKAPQTEAVIEDAKDILNEKPVVQAEQKGSIAEDIEAIVQSAPIPQSIPAVPEITPNTVGNIPAVNFAEVERTIAMLEAKGIDTTMLRSSLEAMKGLPSAEQNNQIVAGAQKWNQQMLQATMGSGMSITEAMDFVQKNYGNLSPQQVQEMLMQQGQAAAPQATSASSNPGPKPTDRTINNPYKVPAGLTTLLANHDRENVFNTLPISEKEQKTLNQYSQSNRSIVTGICELVDQGYIREGAQKRVELSTMNTNRIDEALYILGTHAGMNLLKANDGIDRKGNVDSKLFKKVDSLMISLLSPKTTSPENIAIAMHLADVPIEYNSLATSLSEDYIEARTKLFCAKNNLETPHTILGKAGRLFEKGTEKAGNGMKKAGKTMKSAAEKTGELFSVNEGSKIGHALRKIVETDSPSHGDGTMIV